MVSTNTIETVHISASSMFLHSLLVLLTCLHSMWVVWESIFSSVMVFQNTSSVSLLVFPTCFHLDLCHPHGCYTSSFMFRIFFSILLFTLKTCPYHRILLFTHLSSMIFIFKLFFIPYFSLLVFSICPKKFHSAIRLHLHYPVFVFLFYTLPF